MHVVRQPHWVCELLGVALHSRLPPHAPGSLRFMPDIGNIRRVESARANRQRRWQAQEIAEEQTCLTNSTSRTLWGHIRKKRRTQKRKVPKITSACKRPRHCFRWLTCVALSLYATKKHVCTVCVCRLCMQHCVCACVWHICDLSTYRGKHENDIVGHHVDPALHALSDGLQARQSF